VPHENKNTSQVVWSRYIKNRKMIGITARSSDVTFTPEDLEAGPVYYNYGESNFPALVETLNRLT